MTSSVLQSLPAGSDVSVDFDISYKCPLLVDGISTHINDVSTCRDNSTLLSYSGVASLLSEDVPTGGSNVSTCSLISSTVLIFLIVVYYIGLFILFLFFVDNISTYLISQS